MTERTNSEWLSALRQEGPQRREALADLRKLLLKGLRHSLELGGPLQAEDLEDFVQDALLRILDNLDSFRGESQFLTWAQKIAIRVAYSELRRRRWENISLQDLAIPIETGFIPISWVAGSAGPEKRALQRQALDTLEHVIAQELTEKQRNALVATRICDMPIEEVARRMDTNRNALYKLLHDARVRLKQRLEEAGISSQEMLHLFTAQDTDRQEYEAKR